MGSCMTMMEMNVLAYVNMLHGTKMVLRTGEQSVLICMKIHHFIKGVYG